MRRTAIWLAVITVLGAGTAYLAAGRPEPAKPTSGNPDRHVATAVEGEIERTVRLGGSTAARTFVNIVAPKQMGPESGRDLILVKLAEPGSYVKKGDLLAAIDAQSLQDHLDDLGDTIKQARADLVKRKAEQAVEFETLRQTVRTAKADLEKAKLDAKTAVLLTDIERELLQLSVEEADARYLELEKELALKKDSFVSELRILELTAERHQRHRDRHVVDLTRFTIHAPISGLAVMQTIWRGGDMGQVKKGDQVHSGQLIMRVVDPSSMQVEAFANQTESNELRVGQKAEIHLDAFPNLRFTGEIASIGALATTAGWRQNYYLRRVPVRVAIDGQDPRLIPDLSASADVELASSGQATLVPLAAVDQSAAGSDVYVRNGNTFVRRMVTLGLADNSRVAITSGLRPGEQVRVN